MAYTRNPTWKDWPDKSTPVTADKLENIEQGIVDAATVADEALSRSLAQVTALGLPSSPTVGQTVAVLADPSTVIPSGVTWDSGGAPTVTGRLLISFVWSGSDWVGTYGLPFAAAPGTTTTTTTAAGTTTTTTTAAPTTTTTTTAATTTTTTTAATTTTTTTIATLASDDFNRANSTTSLGVATTGQTWTQHGTGIVGISSNQAYRATSNAFASIDVGQADMKVSVTVAVPVDYFAGPLARVSADGLNFYYVDTGTGGGANARIKKFVAGAEVIVTGSFSYATVAGDVLSISCKENGTGGTIVKLFINGVEKQSLVDTDAGRPITGTRAGIRPFNNGTARLDNFLVESV